jgi:anaphase-promoting complex subunit 3
MLSALSGSMTDENTSNLGEAAPPPTGGLSRSNASSNIQNQPPSSNDPFSISKNRINGDVRPSAGGPVLFEKLNGSRNVVTPLSGGNHYPGLDTPTGPGGGVITEIHPNKEAPGVTAVSFSTEPPLAPMRKARAMQGMGMDFGVEAPPKMRAKSSRPKSRNDNKDSEDADNTSQLSRTSTLSNGIGGHKRTISGQAAQSSSASIAATINNVTAADPAAPQRRSTRLINQFSGRFASSGSIGAKEGRELKKIKPTATKGRSANAFNVGRVVSGNRKHGDSNELDRKEAKPTTADAPVGNTKPAVNDKVKEYESLQWLLDLFTKIGSGYFALCHYQCYEALQLFNSISAGQRDTPWVLAQIGRALFEQTFYAEAEKYFTRIKTMAPARLEDMEVYSTILWHLKNEIDLAFLGHEIVETDRNSPQAWCAVGNSFSLQRDHDQALKCFKRATQLNPKFAYAFTLQGHEHVSNEEYDKALAAYRAAIAADKRHYNAWYGLGKVYEKQGKYAFAERHYRSAATINPTNAVLLCCIGVVLEKMKNPKAALIQYTRSCELAPKSAMNRFKKARVLMALQESQLALQELKVLKDIAPDEANVHFLLGRVYKILRQKGNAIRHFTTALNLDPKVCEAPCSTSDLGSFELTVGAGFALHQRSHGANGR